MQESIGSRIPTLISIAVILTSIGVLVTAPAEGTTKSMMPARVDPGDLLLCIREGYGPSKRTPQVISVFHVSSQKGDYLKGLLLTQGDSHAASIREAWLRDCDRVEIKHSPSTPAQR